MKIFANLLATSIDTRSTAQYEITIETATLYLDVHPNGRHSGTNLVRGTADAITRELVKRYVAANGYWPKHHEIEVSP